MNPISLTAVSGTAEAAPFQNFGAFTVESARRFSSC
jgi:hypothetical protein